MLDFFLKSPKAGILTIRQEPEYCINMYHKNAGCGDCKNVCTEDAVIIGRPGTGIAIDEDKCINCGRCFGACTYGAFRKSGTTEEGFCSSILEKAEKEVLKISCRKNPVTRSYRLECLGGLHAAHLLWLLTKGISSISFYHGACGECRFQNGCAMLEKQIKSVSGVCLSLKGVFALVNYGKDCVTINLTGFPKKRTERTISLNRRDFFKHVGREMVSGITNTIEVFSSQELNAVSFGENEKKRSQRQALLRAVFKTLEGSFEKPLTYDRNLPAGALDIDDSECTACGLCAKLCPTGSLNLEDGHVVHHYDHCTGCQVCIKTCTAGCVSATEEIVI